MKIILVFQGIPHPKYGASQVLYFSYIAELIKNGFEVLVIIENAVGDDVDSRIQDCREAIEDKLKIEFFVLKKKVGFTSSRFKVDYINTNIDDINEQINDFKPNCIVALDLASAATVESINETPKIVWLGDLLFQTTWYNFSYSLKEDWKKIRSLIYILFQCHRWKQYYRKILKKFNRVVVSSKSSEKILKKLDIDSVFYPYPWPNEGSLDVSHKRKLANIPTFLFFGNLVGLGSRSSLHFLFEKLYPLLLNQWGEKGFQIIIGGSLELRDWAKKYVHEIPEIKFKGFIENILEEMSQCHGVLVPVDVPVGNRSRILTAMSKRILVVAHNNVSLGNPLLIDNKTALLAKDEYGFAKKMLYAYEKQDECIKIINSAEKAYSENYQPDVAVGYLLKEINKVCLT